MAIAQGKIKVGIGELSPLAKLKLVPSQDINQFSSEMLINTQQVNKFSLQVGGHVNVKDAFYIMNSEQKIVYDDDMLEGVKQDMTASQISKALGNMFTARKTSRVVLNSFIGVVA